MSRIGRAVAVAAVVGASLTGCVSAALNSLTSNSSSEQLQTLNFESDPPGAEIHTTQGQTCITPCALTVPSQEQLVTTTRDGYMTQTVNVGLQPDHMPPTLVPNPVRIALDPVPKLKPVRHAKSHSAVSTSAPTAPAPSAAFDPSPPPPPSKQ